MIHDYTLDGRFSALWNLSKFGLVPMLCVFAAIAIWGAAGKKAE